MFRAFFTGAVAAPPLVGVGDRRCAPPAAWVGAEGPTDLRALPPIAGAETFTRVLAATASLADDVRRCFPPAALEAVTTTRSRAGSRRAPAST